MPVMETMQAFDSSAVTSATEPLYKIISDQGNQIVVLGEP